MDRNKIDSIVFDYGNTIVFDPFEKILRLESRRFHEIFQKYNYQVDSNEIVKQWAESNRNINYPFVSHFFQEEPIVEDVVEKLLLSCHHTDQIVNELLAHYRSAFLKYLNNDAARKLEVYKTFNELKKMGLKLSVLSNERQTYLEEALKAYGIIECFDEVISSEKLGVEKPEERAFHLMLDRLKTDPERTVYVGDDPNRDIIPACRLRILTILIVPPEEYEYSTKWRSYEQVPSCRPDAIIHSLAEVPVTVSKWL